MHFGSRLLAGTRLVASPSRRRGGARPRFATPRDSLMLAADEPDGRCGARPPAPHRARRVRACAAGHPLPYGAAGPPRRCQLLGLLAARDRGRRSCCSAPARASRCSSCRSTPATTRRATSGTCCVDGHRPRDRVRLPRGLRARTRGPGCCASTATKVLIDPYAQGRGRARDVGRGGGGEGPARAPALAGGRRGVRLGPRAPPRRAARRLGDLRGPRARLHAPPELRRRPPRHLPRASSRRSRT